MDLDSFFVSVERLINPALNGKPVIVGGFSDRGVVSACSYEARRYGVHSAMPIKQARMLCPEALIVKGDMDAYSKKSKEVTDLIAERAPLFEKASIDEHYIDLTGMERFHGCLKFTHELRLRIIKETGLPVSAGLSVNKTVAKMATGQAKPSGELQVPSAEVKPFLWARAIKKMPGIGEKTVVLLNQLGIYTLQDLAECSPEVLQYALGKNGTALWERANGIDHSPVIPYVEAKSVGREETYQTDTTDIQFLRQRIIALCTEVAYELRQKQRMASCVTFKIRYSDFNTYTRQVSIPYTAADHRFISTALQLFEKLYERRLQIRLIGVRASALVPGTEQMSLFDPQSRMSNLYAALDHLRNRYGEYSITKAAALFVKRKDVLKLSSQAA